MPRRQRQAEAPAEAGRPRIQDVARLAGVAVGTVSRVINNHPTVDAEIRARVLRTVDVLGYRPNGIARSLRTAQTRLIGCLVSDFSNPLYSAVLRSAETVLASEGYALLIASTDDDVERELALLDTFASRHIDGLIAVPSHEDEPRLLRALGEGGIPLVLMERAMPLPADVVATDHVGGTRAATAYLLSLGHRRIALITGTSTTRSGRDRLSGYREAFAAHSARLDEALICCGQLTTAFAFAETRRLFAARRPPTAVIAGGNRLLTGVLRALALGGRSIPGDVSVVSSGDTELAELAAPPITVIRWDLAAFGQQVAELLLHRLRHRLEVPRYVVMNTELLLRASCAPPRS